MNYKDRLVTSFPILSEMLNKQSLIAQALVAGGAAGDIAVTGILKGDKIIGVNAPAVLVQTTVAGAAAGDVTVTGIATTDKIVSVIDIAGADLTAEFTVTATDTINNTGGTSSAASVLLVSYETPGAELTREFTIVKDGTINNTSGTATTGLQVLVSWLQWEAR